MKEKFLTSLKLFLIFLKIGLFTFGGGYAMIAIIQNEIVEKRKWLSQDEMFEVIVLSESTPGPVSVNIATYCGYRRAGLLGAIFSTFGLALPSFIIIFIISLFFDEFLKLEIINKAFLGIKVGVMVLLSTTVVKLAMEVKKGIYFYIVFILSLILMILFTIFIPSFNYISLILIALGLLMGFINIFISKKEGDK